MSFVSAIGSLYLNNGAGVSQTIAEVLNQGSDAGGQPLTGLTNCDCDNLTVSTSILAGGANSTFNGVLINADCNVVGTTTTDILEVTSNINAGGADCVFNNVLVNGGLNATGDILTDGLMTADSAIITSNLQIAGNLYPVLDGVNIAYPSVGGIRVNQLVFTFNNPQGVPATTTIAYQKGIYTGKAEIDVGIYLAGGATISPIPGFCTVEIFKGTVAGTNIGYSKTLVGNGEVVSITIPFFVNILNDGDILTFRITCVYDNTGFPVWKISGESDVDVLRIF